MFTKGQVLKYLREWRKVDNSLDKIYKRGDNKWRWLFGNLIHDGRQTARKVRLLLSANKSEEITRHQITLHLTWFIAIGKYVIDKEG